MSWNVFKRWLSLPNVKPQKSRRSKARAAQRSLLHMEQLESRLSPAAGLTVTPITWDYVGPDSHLSASGPTTFLVGVRVTNISGSAMTNVTAKFQFDGNDANFVADGNVNYINLSPSSLATLSVPALAASGAGASTDFYYDVTTTLNANVFGDSRPYEIDVTSDQQVTPVTSDFADTGTHHQVYVTQFQKQSNDSVNSISVTGPGISGTYTSTGSNTLTVYANNTYTVTVNASTSTGFDEVENVMDFPNAVFQILSASSTYSKPGPPTGVNDIVFGDASGWDSNPATAGYNTEIAPTAGPDDPSYNDLGQHNWGGKVGGTIVTTYQVYISSVGNGTLSDLIEDHTGTADHYNADFGTGVNAIAFTATYTPTTSNNTVTTTEGSAYTFKSSDFPFGDQDNTKSLQSVTISTLPTGGTFKLSGVAVTAGQVIPVAQLGNLVYTPTAGSFGSPDTSFQFTVSDGTASSGTATETIDVTPLAPTTSNNTVTTTEGSAYTFKSSDFPFTDPDNDGETLQAVTISTLPTGGTFKLSGVTVTAGQVISVAQLGNLVYTPTAGSFGSPYASFQFSVSDGTASSGTATETINVASPAPTTSNNTVTTTEGSAYTFKSSDFPFGDQDNTKSLQSVTISTLPTGGTFQLSGVAVTAGQVIPVAQLGNLVYTPTAGSFGSPDTSFQFTVSDGTTSSGTATETIDVTPLAPTTSNNTVTTTEGYAYTFKTSDFPFTDPDSDGETLQAVTISTLPTGGTFKLSGVAVTAGQVIPVAQIGNLVYTPTAGSFGSPYASFQFTVSDGIVSSSTATETIDVTPLAPTSGNNTVTTTEGSAYTFKTSDFPLTDPDNDGETLQAVTISTLPTGGTFKLSGVAVTAGQVIPVAQIGNLVYTPTAGSFGSPDTTFQFTVSDGTASSGTATETIDVTPLAPTTSNNAVTTTEGSAYTFKSSDFPYTDPDNDGETLQAVTISTLPTGGTFKLSGVAVTAGQVISVAQLGNLVYTPTAGSFGSPDTTFQFTVSDGTASSGTATETINVTPLAPTTANNTVTTTEGSAYTFKSSDFPYTDPDNDGETLQSVTIGTLPAGGTFKLSGVAVTAGQVIPVAQLGNLVYTPTAGSFGSPYASFQFSVSDGTASSSTATETINVASPAPTTSNNTVTTTEGSAYTFKSSDFPFSDQDNTKSLQAVTISTLPTGGTFKLSGVAVTAGQVIPVAQLGNLVYTPTAGSFGSPYASFQFSVSNGTASSSTGTETINVTPLAPTTANNTVTTPEGSVYTFKSSDFPLTDPDNDGETLQAVTIVSLPGSGTLKLGGVAVTAGQMIPFAQLTNLTYTPPVNQAGSPLASFNFNVFDGFLFSNTASIAVNVTMQASPPIIAPISDIYLNNCTSFPLTYAGSFSDTTNSGPWTGTVNYGDGSGVQPLMVNSNQTFYLSHTFSLRGVYEVDISITNASNLTSTTSFFLGAHFTLPQGYSQLVTINDGSVQRSMVTSITLSFGQHETLGTGAISLTTLAGLNVGFRTLTRDINGQTVVLIQFTGPTLIGESLADGRYTLTINGADIHNSQGVAYDGGNSITDNFWRLFGDAYGTASVNNSDLAAFRAALRSVDGTPPYVWYFDYDQNCTIDAAAYSAFLNRYGKSI